MSDLRDLYQEVILDHNKRPRNFGTLPGANRVANGFNPLCGDKLRLSLRLSGEVIEDIRFDGWHAKHDFPRAPQAVGHALIERTIGTREYWESRRVLTEE